MPDMDRKRLNELKARTIATSFRVLSREETADLLSLIDELAEALREVRDGPQPLDEYLTGVRCGVEDRDLQYDPYEAAEYAYQTALEWTASVVAPLLAKLEAPDA